ncbi:HesA/MoeB/ThiF family protein [uncultured Christiangramia sp.]|uniref:HesA/MoeB/ThiF family protein n=1 Tax=uncultured Christiangramia sp. TaxID=503836 RepID=UPI00262D2444|nr:HesA/MoeB/ThiF family protein [uncultured Christiangramia sp.]
MNIEDRFAVHHKLSEIGTEGQRKLKAAKIAIVGLGGLGSNVAIGLIGLGIGHLTLIDDDTVHASNLARQILYTEKDIGFPKSLKAKERLILRNSEIVISVFEKRLNSKNSCELLKEHDIIIDGTDNIVSRLSIDSFCAQYKIPLIYAGLEGFSGQVSVFNYNSGKSFSETFANLEELFSKENCSDSGVILPLASIVSNIQVLQAFNIILDRKPVFQGVLQIINLQNLTFRQFKLS